MNPLICFTTTRTLLDPNIPDKLLRSVCVPKNRKTDSANTVTASSHQAQHTRARSQPLRSKSTALQATANANAVPSMPSSFQTVAMNRRWVNWIISIDFPSSNRFSFLVLSHFVPYDFRFIDNWSCIQVRFENSVYYTYIHISPSIHTDIFVSTYRLNILLSFT